MSTYEQVRDKLLAGQDTEKIINIEEDLLQLLSPSSRAMVWLLRDLVAEKKRSCKT